MAWCGTAVSRGVKHRKEKDMDFEKAAEKRKQDITREALRLLRANLQKEYVELEAEWKKISAEYLGRINVIDVMLVAGG